MGIFQDMVTVINLAPIPLTVTFDGQTTRIPPGESPIPRVTVLYAKNQNPVSGSADMNNPHLSGARYLISVKGAVNERQEPFTPEEWKEITAQSSRWNMEDYFADRLGPKEHIEVRGKGRKTQARSSFDAGVRVTPGETLSESN